MKIILVFALLWGAVIFFPNQTTVLAGAASDTISKTMDQVYKVIL